MQPEVHVAKGSVIPMTTSFGNDILPMFRPGDVACMTPKGVRLSDADWICDPAGNGDFADHANARLSLIHI